MLRNQVTGTGPGKSGNRLLLSPETPGHASNRVLAPFSAQSQHSEVASEPRSPTTTGKVERFHQTLKRELLRKHRFGSLQEAQAAVDRWVGQYNQDRPHQSIGMRTPADRFHSGTAIPVSVEESAVRPSPTEIHRRVWSNAVVRVADQAVSVGRPYAGELVTIRVQGAILHVLHDGRLRNSRREVRYLRGRRSPKGCEPSRLGRCQPSPEAICVKGQARLDTCLSSQRRSRTTSISSGGGAHVLPIAEWVARTGRAIISGPL